MQLFTSEGPFSSPLSKDGDPMLGNFSSRPSTSSRQAVSVITEDSLTLDVGAKIEYRGWITTAFYFTLRIPFSPYPGFLSFPLLPPPKSPLSVFIPCLPCRSSSLEYNALLPSPCILVVRSLGRWLLCGPG